MMMSTPAHGMHLIHLLLHMFKPLAGEVRPPARIPETDGKFTFDRLFSMGSVLLHKW